MLTILFLLKIAFFVYAAVAVFFSIILWLFGKYFQKIKDKTFLRLARIMTFFIVLPVLVGPVIWLEAAVIGPNWIETKTIVVESPVFNSKLEEIKIVQISDLHIEQIGKREEQLIKIVNELKPDVILMNGDFVNSRAGWEPCLEVLKQLRAKVGIYTILGNTDYYFAEEQEMVRWLNEVGIIVLTKSNIRLNLGQQIGELWLVGLSDLYGTRAQYGQTPYVDDAFANVPAEKAKILLIHDPDQVELKKIKDYQPQLVLAGDTHGGQVGIPWIRNLSSYANRSQYMQGRFNVNGIPLYVNRGIGMKTLNIRFLCRPEVTVIKLLKKS